MTREALEHIIRAAAMIVDDNDLLVIGSQSVLGEFPHAPAELRISREADVYPRTYPERADLIDSTIGEDSPFDRSFGYYAHGVAWCSSAARIPASSEAGGSRCMTWQSPNTRPADRKTSTLSKR
jgi:hypothetical protein